MYIDDASPAPAAACELLRAAPRHGCGCAALLLHVLLLLLPLRLPVLPVSTHFRPSLIRSVAFSAQHVTLWFPNS